MPVANEDEPLLSNSKSCNVWCDSSKVIVQDEHELTGEVLPEVSEQFTLQWLKEEAEEEDVVRVMTQLLAARPELEASLLTAINACQVGMRTLQRKSTWPSFFDPGMEHQEEVLEDRPTDVPRLRFTTCSYFVGEEEEKVEIEVTRSGNLNYPSKVHLHTNDLSAKAGVNYVPESRMLVFKPGVDSITVSVTLIASDEWSPTLEFEVILESSSTANAELDVYGRCARVKIDDKDAFPSNVVDVRKLSKSLSWEHLRQALENAPLLILMSEYLKLNFRNDTVRRGTIKMLMALQCHHLYGILRLFLSVLLVDKVFKGGEEFPSEPPQSLSDFLHSRPGMLVCVMCGMLVPFAFLHYLDYVSMTWRVGGASRAQLLSALVRRLLHYDVSSRIDIKQGAEIMAMSKDVEDIVQNGYMGVLEIISHLQNLATVLAYQVISRLILQEPISPWSIAPLAVHPILLALFAVCRRSATIHVQQAENVERASLVSQMQSVTLNNTIIRNLGGVAKAIDQFERGIASFNASCINTMQVMKNNMYFANWMGLVMLAAYTLVGGLEVVDGKMRMGIFLADITLFTQINITWSMICSRGVEINSILPGLERVVILMNLPTDLPDRRKLLRHLVSASRGMRSIMETNSPEKRLHLDDLPLFLKGPLIEFSVKSQQGEFFIRKVALQLSGELYIHQGEFIALVGLHGHGKSSILKMFGGELLPGEGNLPGFFVPPHLRVLHVGTEPGLFHGTLYDNLIFGVAEGAHRDDADRERVKHICQLLALPEEILALLDVPDKLCWDQVLSHTQQAKLGLARALVANPDVLLLHKPAMPYDDRTSHMVLEVIKSHVKNHGVGYAKKPLMRSPRTCIFTSSKRYGLQLADRIYLIGPTGLIQEVQAEDVTEGMLA
ncbi:unnamed protein product [Durusdinium trenchii]|uniref:ABC transporter domain-containing protein n=1 Tax=Durusdinium trenchii TaxID=1381693 RepID=A0ABP0HFF0_9DINO